MKTLKFNHEMAELIRQGKKTVTWRVNDEKNISVDDEIWIIDKVDKRNPDTWLAIGTAKVTEILAKHLSDIQSDELGSNEQYASKQAMVETFQKYYGPDINEHTAVKIIHFTFTPQEPAPLETIEDKNTTNITEVKVYADGGSRGNPGPSASGFVVMTMDDGIIEQGGLYLGLNTNNQAEYTGLKIGLQEATKRGVKIVHVFMDSELVVNQMKGVYKVRNAAMASLNNEIRTLVKRFDQVTFTHVPREMNKLADAMVNEVLDATDLS